MRFLSLHGFEYKYDAKDLALPKWRNALFIAKIGQWMAKIERFNQGLSLKVGNPCLQFAPMKW